MRNGRELTHWSIRAAVAGLGLILVAQLGSETPPVRAAPLAGTSKHRLPMVSPLPGMAPGEVRSLLAVETPLRYGQFIWKESDVPEGPIAVRVDREAQILSVFRGGHEIATTTILYGAPEKATPAGRYPVRSKTRLHVSRAYGAEMPFTLWLTADGIAIHASDVRQGAATHGCIGVPKDFAERLYHLVKAGDPVVIA